MIALEREQNNIKGLALAVNLLVAVHCTAFFGAIMNMAGIRSEILIAAGASLVALYPLLCKEHRHVDRMGAIAVGILLVMTVICWRQCFNGGKIFLNRLFLQSAERQQYRYQMYDVNGKGLPVFIGVSSAMVAAAAAWTASRSRPLCGILFPVTVAGTGAYFGLTPAWMWMILLVITSGAMLFPSMDRRRVLQFLAAAVILFGLVFLLAPGENTSLSEKDEQWRDQLAQTTVADEQNPSISSSKEEPQPEPEETEKDPVMLRLEKSVNKKTVLIISVIALILLLLFVPAVIKDRIQKKRDKAREGMYDEDRSAAIQAVFRVALLWIRASGISVPTESFSRLKSNLGKSISQNCASEYGRILPIWQEAVFSDHEMSEEQWNQVMSFEQHIETALMETASRWQKWKYKYIHAL